MGGWGEVMHGWLGSVYGWGGCYSVGMVGGVRVKIRWWILVYLGRVY